MAAPASNVGVPSLDILKSVDGIDFLRSIADGHLPQPAAVTPSGSYASITWTSVMVDDAGQWLVSTRQWLNVDRVGSIRSVETASSLNPVAAGSCSYVCKV